MRLKASARRAGSSGAVWPLCCTDALLETVGRFEVLYCRINKYKTLFVCLFVFVILSKLNRHVLYYIYGQSAEFSKSESAGSTLFYCIYIYIADVRC